MIFYYMVGKLAPSSTHFIAELGRNPVVSKHQIQPEFGDEQTDAGRDDCRTRLARTNFRRERTRTRKYSFFLSS